MPFLSLLSVKRVHTPPAGVVDPPPAAPKPAPLTKHQPEPTSNIREIIKLYNSRPEPEAKPFESVRSVSPLLLCEVQTHFPKVSSDQLSRCIRLAPGGTLRFCRVKPTDHAVALSSRESNSMSRFSSSAQTCCAAFLKEE